MVVSRAHMVSDVQNKDQLTPVKINQDANVFVTEVSAGNTVRYELAEGRQAYLLCMEGEASVTGQHGGDILSQHDGAEVFGPNTFEVAPTASTASSHVLMVEMAFTGPGRSDL